MANVYIDDFSFELPPGRIAQQPVRQRDRSRLMAVERGTGERADLDFRDLPTLLREGDLMVFNDSAVMPARLVGFKSDTGGRVELLLLAKSGRGRWSALAKGTVRRGTRLEFGLPHVEARVTEVREGGAVTVAFHPPGGGDQLMEAVGRTPLPPYIKRPGKTTVRERERDRQRYQTIYARTKGSVAAPTAGLHFTEHVLKESKRKGCALAFLTLHVGGGTFRPLRHREISRNRLEPERTFLPAATAEAVRRTKRAGGRVIAVGTTTVRVLEASAGGPNIIRGGRRKVDLFIRPGHPFSVVDGLITNFHLPRSSLLLLVAAFLGKDRTLDAYRHALDGGYRFYSYGDVMAVL